MKKIQKVLLLGSGALKIGEAGEFDYSGSQAIKALKEEGLTVILVNPNIATVQTSEGLADEVYFLPVTADFVEKIMLKEHPDGILLSFGGQTALNCGLELNQRGILSKYNVRVLGTPIEAIIATEDREKFSKALSSINVVTAKGTIIASVDQAVAFASSIGFPVMVRTGFALGGTGSGIARNAKELTILVEKALVTTRQIIVEESLAGWKEIEYEVVRDIDNNCITVCNMENMDPVGIHTGESIVVAPSQTLTNDEYFSLRQKSIDVIRMLKIVGECNIQFALNPKNGTVRVIEVNARLSRSSALASKATGYPLAYIAAKLALGKTLPTLPNLITKTTTAFFEPALDYVVVKLPRWDLEKFTHVVPVIGSEMKSVGEVMSIGRTFEEAIQKAARMLNDGYNGVIDEHFSESNKKVLLQKLSFPNTLRLFTICSAIRAGIPITTIAKQTQIDSWFLQKLAGIVSFYKDLKGVKGLSKEFLKTAKQFGFSDKQIADIKKMKEDVVRKKRIRFHILPAFKRIDTMAGEFPAQTNYLYCTYNAELSDVAPQTTMKRAIVLGCGPYAIGTSVEFDWCAVETVKALKRKGIEAIMINCNPETVSTDFDISDRLYFEELTLERVLDIYHVEQAPCIVSVGGQVPNNISKNLNLHKVPILGTTPQNIFRAEHRKIFSALLDHLHIAQPGWAEVTSTNVALKIAETLHYPILVRPSFVLSGKAMSVIAGKEEFEEYLHHLDLDMKEYPLVMTSFLKDSREFDFDGVAQNGKMLASVISEHIEEGGVHSGDSSLMLPSPNSSKEEQAHMQKDAARIVKALRVNGPFNIQFLLSDQTPYVIECNLRASRSFPFVSKVTHVNFIDLATEVMLRTKHISVPPTKNGFTAVKVPQFSFQKLRGADPVTRVEMSSTGEVVGLGRDPYEAYLKGMLATGVKYPTKKAALVSLGGAPAKLRFLESCQKLIQLGFTIYATGGTNLFLKEYSIVSQRVGKIHEKTIPNILDLLVGRKIDFLVVVSEGRGQRTHTFRQSVTEGYVMRRLAVDTGIPIFTNTNAARFFIEAISRYEQQRLYVGSWKEYRNIST